MQNQDIIACRACPRLVKWRETVAREKRAAFAQETYWGKPLCGFGDEKARLLLVVSDTSAPESKSVDVGPPRAVKPREKELMTS